MADTTQPQKKYRSISHIIISLPFPIGLIVAHLTKGDKEFNPLTLGLCVAIGYALICLWYWITKKRGKPIKKEQTETK